MSTTVIVCARCTTGNHPSSRFCVECGLPLGSASPDADAGVDAIGPYETPDPSDPDTPRLLREFVERSGFEAGPSGHGWRIVIPLRLDRKQAVYAGYGGTDQEGRAIISLVSVCGPANDRDARILLKFNAGVVEGHFAMKVLRGEEYFVVVDNLPAEAVECVDATRLVRRIAETADRLEDRLSRGLDLY